jgi:sigma-B regulation protein RsbU (phosphoserine phosphatase)
MKRILVVDDQEHIANLAELILTSSGYSCTKANSGKQALKLIYDNQNNYDLVLMDLAMPEVSGIDVLKKLKQDGMLERNKIVFFSASSLTGPEKDDLKKIGALDAMNKPFTKSELLGFVEKHAK